MILREVQLDQFAAKDLGLRVKINQKTLRHRRPGDSIRDLFIPDRWRSPTTF